jgi:diguanylate cyclase (GGDEF)-like protein/PAS domain S-box-containing protein
MMLPCLALMLVIMSAMKPLQAAEKTTVRVGLFDNQPILFESSPGEYAGLAVDVLDDIARQENWQLEYVLTSFRDMLRKLESGDVDLVVGIAYNQARARHYDFTRETLINNWGTVYRAPNMKITSLADLQGKRVALARGTIHAEVFREIMSQFQFDFEAVEVVHYRDGMAAVQQGNADATVINRVISLLHSTDYGLLETGIIFNPVEVRYATLKGKAGDLLVTIDRHLATQKQDRSSAYHQSLERWLHTATSTRLPQWLPLAVAIAAVALLVLGISNLLIRKQVAARTAELSESELRFRQLAENINEIFWIGSPDWQQMYYISPTFETVYKRSRESLYANPMLWMEAIHEDDRQRVHEDLRNKIAGRLENPAFPEFRIVNETGIRWILARAYPIRDENSGDITRIVGIAEDITERKQAHETIHFMAHHDPLTRLTNRFAFEKSLNRIIDTRPQQQHAHALMYIDLDQFKIINDTCGHAAGDQMLIDLAKLLLNTVGERGILARLGGDEFGLLLQDSSLDEARQLGQLLLDTIKGFRFGWNGQRFSVGASIGLVMIDRNDMARSELLSAADMACYAAKETGRNRLQVYSQDDAQLLQRHGEMQWVSRLQAALEDNRFVLYRQTIKPLQQDNRHFICDEYLFRMLDENGVMVMPGSFIPAAERFEIMPQLDRWVVSNVIARLALERRTRSGKNGYRVAFINLSGQVFNDDHFASFIMEQCRQHAIDASSICLEITETAAIFSLDKAIAFIKQLREQGFQFALDDFGSGMSSFSYLKFLPVDFLKIDGVFIKGLLQEPMNVAIVEAITQIGHAAGLKVIAEWVEDETLLSRLAEMGIDFAQGYAINKPTRVDDAPDRAING